MVPKKIATTYGSTFEFDAQTGLFGHKPQYRYKHNKCGILLFPCMIETEFKKDGRPEPEANIIQQGKYECGPAALAMLLGVSLYEAKRACAAFGWNNDDGGISDETLVKAAEKLGFYLAKTDYKKDTPCIISVPSLNYKGRTHALCYDGNEMLDPNYKKAGRHYYGTEWKPWSIGAEEVLEIIGIDD